MPEPNRLLRAARERLPSPGTPGEHASRAEVADALNAWLWRATRKRYALDAHYLAKLERGVVRWPSAAYRSGLRHVLGVPDDASLGFTSPRRHGGQVTSPVPEVALPSWDADAAVERACAVVEADLMPSSRRGFLAVSALLAGSALTAELSGFLWPATAGSMRRGTSAFTPPELAALEEFTGVLRYWHSANGAVVRLAVVAQLDAHVRRLREAPQGAAETLHAFRIGAELADIAATMAWDSGDHGTAQKYFVLAAHLAHAGGDDALAAVALASMARQCCDLGRPDDGLEVVQLAQYGTRRTATPRLRAVLATREAWAHALLGDARAFQRAVGLAEDHHAEGVRDGDECTPSVRSMDDAELAGVIGARYRDLARYDVKFTGKAQEYIGRALTQRPPERVRNRVFDLIGLARVHLVARELHEAAEMIQLSLPLARPWLGGRVGVKLRDFAREAAPFDTVPAVRDAREAVADLVAR